MFANCLKYLSTSTTEVELILRKIQKFLTVFSTQILNNFSKQVKNESGDLCVVEKLDIVLDNVKMVTGNFYIEGESSTSTDEPKNIDYSKAVFKEKIDEHVSSELNILATVSFSKSICIFHTKYYK